MCLQNFQLVLRINYHSLVCVTTGIRQGDPTDHYIGNSYNKKITLHSDDTINN